jgi:hypothetical protein
MLEYSYQWFESKSIIVFYSMYIYLFLNKDQCCELVHSPLSTLCDVLLIKVQNQNNILSLANNNMKNLWVLNVHRQDVPMEHEGQTILDNSFYHKKEQVISYMWPNITTIYWHRLNIDVISKYYDRLWQWTFYNFRHWLIKSIDVIRLLVNEIMYHSLNWF